MKIRGLFALILSFILITSMLPQSFVYAEEISNTDKGIRQVYLHAFDDTPALNTSANRHTVYMGEDTNIYFAVDNPNKGEYLSADHPDVVEAERIAREKATAEAEKKPGFSEKDKQEYIEYEVAKAVELARHSQPQYDMQGYTIKIYFDTKYFRFKDSENPLDLKEPNMGGEDFAYFAQKVPSAFMFVGIANNESEPVIHHNPYFKWDSKNVGILAQSLSQIALDYLK